MSKHSIVVVGSGVTSLATVLELQRQGLKDIALIIPLNDERHTRFVEPGFAQAACFDNLTRVAQAHGKEFACEMTAWTKLAYATLAEAVQKLQIPWYEQNSRFRFIVAQDELNECHEAIRLMRNCGYPSSIISEHKHFSLTSRVLATQLDPLPCAYFEPKKLLTALFSQATNHLALYRADIHCITPSSADLTINAKLASGTSLTIHSDMLVLGHHREISAMLETARNMVFPNIEQIAEKIGTFWSAHHGHEWGGILPGRHLRFCIGGGRYLRNAEGFDSPESKAGLNGRIGKFLLQKLLQTFMIPASVRSVIGQVGVYSKTCDELPVVGPWIGENRILIATGFQNQELTLGYLAGRHLADCIMTGQMPGLPTRLHPRRWMTLMERH